MSNTTPARISTGRGTGRAEMVRARGEIASATSLGFTGAGTSRRREGEAARGTACSRGVRSLGAGVAPGGKGRREAGAGDEVVGSVAGLGRGRAREDSTSTSVAAG